MSEETSNIIFDIKAKPEYFSTKDEPSIVQVGFDTVSNYYIKIINVSVDTQLEELDKEFKENKSKILSGDDIYNSKDNYNNIIKPLILYFIENNIDVVGASKTLVDVIDWFIKVIKERLDKNYLEAGGNVIESDEDMPELIKPLKPAVTAESKKKKEQIITQQKAITKQKQAERTR